jgi:hypothetical protein
MVMTQEFDPKKSYLTLKANEMMVAFVGFLILLEESGAKKEGVLKISAFQRPYGGGSLTLTFIVDTEGNGLLRSTLDQQFKNITKESLIGHLGDELEKIVKVSLDSLAHAHGWYVEEVGIHFKAMTERLNVLIEEKLIPGLEDTLPFSFDPVEWWPKGRHASTSIGEEINEHMSVKSLFKKWFGAG